MWTLPKLSDRTNMYPHRICNAALRLVVSQINARETEILADKVTQLPIAEFDEFLRTVCLYPRDGTYVDSTLYPFSADSDLLPNSRTSLNRQEIVLSLSTAAFLDFLLQLSWMRESSDCYLIVLEIIPAFFNSRPSVKFENHPLCVRYFEETINHDISLPLSDGIKHLDSPPRRLSRLGLGPRWVSARLKGVYDILKGEAASTPQTEGTEARVVTSTDASYYSRDLSSVSVGFNRRVQEIHHVLLAVVELTGPLIRVDSDNSLLWDLMDAVGMSRCGTVFPPLADLWLSPEDGIPTDSTVSEATFV